jgi:flagellar motor switch protein FliG
MATNPPSNVEKAAILLRRLPPPSLTKVLEMIGAENSTLLQRAILNVANRPDLAELDELVLQEFRDMQREVRESLRGSPQLENLLNGKSAGIDSAAFQEGADSANDDKSGGGNGTTTGEATAITDPIAELLNTPPEVIAVALKKETLHSCTLVLRELPTDFTGKILEHMPPESRQQIFMLLAMRTTVHPAVIKKVLHAIVEVCRTIDVASAGDQQDERFKTLVGILQMVEREERLRLMDALTEQDEELAAQIDDILYDYADILRIQDRSVQKLLTQLELKVVALALKTAPQPIIDKVMANLSERVRATLTEEMELLSSVTPAKVDQARKEIANVIRLQDKDGTLQWIE